MRIAEFSRTYGVEVEDLLDKCDELGIDATTAQSNLGDRDLELRQLDLAEELRGVGEFLVRREVDVDLAVDRRVGAARLRLPLGRAADREVDAGTARGEQGGEGETSLENRRPHVFSVGLHRRFRRESGAVSLVIG